MKNIIISFLLLLAGGNSLFAQTFYSWEMARSHGYNCTHGKNWDYVSGLVAKSLLDLCEWYGVEDGRTDFYIWAKDYADRAIDENGIFKDFRK